MDIMKGRFVRRVIYIMCFITLLALLIAALVIDLIAFYEENNRSLPFYDKPGIDIEDVVSLVIGIIPVIFIFWVAVRAESIVKFVRWLYWFSCIVLLLGALAHMWGIVHFSFIDESLDEYIAWVAFNSFALIIIGLNIKAIMKIKEIYKDEEYEKSKKEAEEKEEQERRRRRDEWWSKLTPEQRQRELDREREEYIRQQERLEEIRKNMTCSHCGMRIPKAGYECPYCHTPHDWYD